MSAQNVDALRQAGLRILSHESSVDSWAADYLVHQSPRLAEDLDILEKYASRNSTQIVEIGSSPPFITAAMNELGFRVIGLDIDPTRFGEATRGEGLDIRLANIESEPFPVESASVDLVLMNEVFEHLRSPLVPITEIERILRPGGVLLLSTPNLRSFRGIINLVLRGKGWAVGADPSVEHRKPEEIGHMGHVREYTPVEVGGVLKSFGLHPETVIHRGSLGPLPERLFYKVVPVARPFFTIVARKAS